MKTFIRAAEIWVPTKDRMQLEFLDGLYGPLGEFRAVSEQMRFGFDEGLPGKAWASGHPIILKQFENSYFKRTEAAKAAGLTCGVALPVFAGEFLMAVVVFFCGDDEAHIGAIELWHNDPDKSYEMRLVDGYYGTADMFEFNSRHTRFPRGFGLPGRVWKSGMPTDREGPVQLHGFSALAAGDGDRHQPRSRDSLSAPVRSYLGDDVLVGARHADCASLRNLGPERSARCARFSRRRLRSEHAIGARLPIGQGRQGEGTVGQVWLTGIPRCARASPTTFRRAGRSALAAGLSAMVAVPIMRGHGLSAVVVWYF